MHSIILTKRQRINLMIELLNNMNPANSSEVKGTNGCRTLFVELNCFNSMQSKPMTWQKCDAPKAAMDIVAGRTDRYAAAGCGADAEQRAQIAAIRNDAKLL